jgi:hypothetical protein
MVDGEVVGVVVQGIADVEDTRRYLSQFAVDRFIYGRWGVEPFGTS